MTPLFDADRWSSCGLHVEVPTRGPGLAMDSFLLVRFDLRPRGPAVLPRELCRSLSSWLSWHADGHAGDPRPANPDAVRVAIEEKRAELRARSAGPGDLEDFRAGLAWAEHALAAVAEVAAGKERA